MPPVSVACPNTETRNGLRGIALSVLYCLCPGCIMDVTLTILLSRLREYYAQWCDNSIVNGVTIVLSKWLSADVSCM